MNLHFGISSWSVGAMVAQSLIEDRFGPWLLMLILAAAVSVWTGRVAHARLNGVLLVFSVSAAVALAATWIRGTRFLPIQQVIESCAVLSLLWTLVAVGIGRVLRASTERDATLVREVRLAALLFGAASVIPMMLILIMRAVLVGVDLLHGFPTPPLRPYGFEAVGLWSVVLLCVSCAASWRSTGQARLAACGFWLLVVGSAWSALLVPPLRRNLTGGFERSEMSLVLLAALSAVMIATLVSGRARKPKDPPILFAHPGLPTGCAVLSVLILILGCYHLLVPVVPVWGGIVLARLAVFGCLAGCALALGSILRRTWTESFGDAAMALASLSICAAALVVSPPGQGSLSETYPSIFNAIIIALTLATAGWTWFGCVWVGRIPASESGFPPPAAIFQAKRFAFLCAALALVAAAIMTYWPRIPSISAMDHSLNRVLAGFGAHLFLLLVMLWSSRRLKRMTFHMLTLLSVFSTAGFILVRMIPFASRGG